MRLYKKYCFSSKDYEECVKITEECARQNGVSYLIDLIENKGEYIGYLLVKDL